MGVKIERPSIYLGSKKDKSIEIAKKYKKIISEKIGSQFIHVENKKTILEMSYEACKK